MQIKKVEFIKSASKIEECPKPFYPEIAFIGRSNVGKSSLINLICDNKKLAKVSETPGKTRTINHYLVNGNWYLVDLPGYGFAKVSQDERKKFQKMIETYILKRDTLKCTMVLIDSRLEFQKSDKEFILWLGQNQLPFAVVLTKIDKLSKSQLNKQLQYFEKEFYKLFDTTPNIFATSATEKVGREELLEFLEYVMGS
ncbi:MAG: putative GTP-binding protein EngB [Bacteroidia bacterium]|nr:MAG: putative GTP-binding protein EngB [Bacteroidia bacterium]